MVSRTALAPSRSNVRTVPPTYRWINPSQVRPGVNTALQSTSLPSTLEYRDLVEKYPVILTVFDSKLAPVSMLDNYCKPHYLQIANRCGLFSSDQEK